MYLVIYISFLDLPHGIRMGSLPPAGNKDEDKYDNRLIPLIRESSFNMTRGGGNEDIETRSLKF